MTRPRSCGFARDEAKCEWNDTIPSGTLRSAYFVPKIGQQLLCCVFWCHWPLKCLTSYWRGKVKQMKALPLTTFKGTVTTVMI